MKNLPVIPSADGGITLRNLVLDAGSGIQGVKSITFLSWSTDRIAFF
jgi:hypothetical protein